MADYPMDRIFAPSDLVRAIADDGNTPFFLYDMQGIQASISGLHQAFSWMPGYQNYFPLRENMNPHILRLLQQAGTGVSVCSRAELQLALSCGFSGDQLLYEPSRLDTDAEHMAKEAGAVWLFDSAAFIPENTPDHMILRYNPIDLQLPPPQKQTIMRSKTGLNREQLFAAAAQLKQRGVTRIGLAVQISTYSIQSGFWARKASILFRLSQELMEKTGLSICSCHLGEGPGLPYHPRISAPDIQAEADLLRSAYDKQPETCRPVVVTGVSSRMLEPHGLLVTKVLEERAIFRTFLILDAGICQYSRPVLKQAYRHVSVLGRSQVENRRLYSLVGDLPNSFDRLVYKGRMLPKVLPGDYCVIHDVGCSARSMPMLYGIRPVAAEFLYMPDGTIQQIAPGRTEEDVLRFLTAW